MALIQPGSIYICVWLCFGPVNKQSMWKFACRGCWLLTEGDPSNAFPLPREENVGWSSRALGQRPVKSLKYFLFLAFSRRAVTACGISRVPKMTGDPRWCRGTLLHQCETSLNFGKEDFGSLVVIYSRYTINRVHCMCQHFFSTYRLCLKIVLGFFP